MKWSDLIVEGSSYPLLYHKTNADEAARIIFSGKLAAFSSHRSGDLGFKDHSEEFLYGVCLTRSLTFAKQWRDKGVIFVLDERKLRQRFRIKPHDYNRGGFKNTRAEAEEFVLTNTGIPLAPNLIEILVPRDLYQLCVGDNADYEDPHSVEDTRYAALTDHPLIRLI
jgi:hypothetical protein